jgi:hypothetical protein
MATWQVTATVQYVYEVKADTLAEATADVLKYKDHLDSAHVSEIEAFEVDPAEA